MSEPIQRTEYSENLRRIYDRMDEHAKDDTSMFRMIGGKLDILLEKQANHHEEAVKTLERVEMQQLQIGDLKKNSTTTETRLTNLKGQSGAKLFGRFSFLAGVASLFRNW